MRLARAICCLLFLAAACAEGPGSVRMAVPQTSPTNAPLAPLPAFPDLGAALPAGHTAYSNESLAQLFVTLALEMEWGARRPNLVRYEVPVSVEITGAGAERYFGFLDDYLAMIARNSGVDVARRSPANLHIRLVDSRSFDRLLPTAFCVVAQGDTRWASFSKDPGGRGADALANARTIDQMTIFIPGDAPPYLVRNCLLEETPQSMGVANDLYGLGPSIFNDDAAHLWPTKLDFLMLRVLYQPEMHTGLDRRQTEERALAVLNRINPAGVGAPPLPLLRQHSLGEWSDLVGEIFSRDTSEARARDYAEKALVIVQANAPGSAQHCHTLITAGRVLSRSDPARALRLFGEAARVCDIAHGISDIRQARIKLESACALLRLGRYGEVERLTEEIWPVLAAYGQDERLAALYTMQSAALAVTDPGSARTAAARQLAAEWSAYAFGPGVETASGCRANG